MKKIKSFLLIMFVVNVFLLQAQNEKPSNSDEIGKTATENLYEDLNEKEGNPFLVINEILFGKNIVVLSLIDPKDIESVNVLKDKAATELYGEKGKQGVLIVYLKDKSINTIEKFKTRYGLHNSKEKEVAISGVVYDSENNAIPNVFISNLNRKESFKSGSKGEFLLKARKNDILFFNLNGFKSQTIKVNDTKINVVLVSNPKTEIFIR